MVKNDWLSANEALKRLLAAYERFTGQPVMPALRMAQIDLRSLIEASEQGQNRTRLESLRSVHLLASATRATAAMEMCEELILVALESGALSAIPMGGFRFSPRSGSSMGVGLYGQAGTIPIRFWEMFRADKSREIDWTNGDFEFGKFIVHSVFGQASKVHFEHANLHDLEAKLGALVGSGLADDLAEAEKQAENNAKRGRPKGAGGHAEADGPFVAEMRELIEANPGMTPHAAAVQIAYKAPGRATEETKVRRLADRYREKFEVD